MQILRHFSFTFFFFCALYFQACTKAEEVSPTPEGGNPVVMTDPSSDTSGISYLALGDSYTIGQGVSAMERYPRQLADSFLNNEINFKELKVIAATGWTTGNLSTALDAAGIGDGDYNLVSLLIGVNNQFRGDSFDEYKTEFTALLDRAIAYAGGNKKRVFVLSIPDYGVTPFGQIYGSPQRTAEDIDRFNAANLAISESREVRYFDITPISREALNDPDLVASDGLHPSGEMYRRWVELMLPELLQMLGE